MTEPYAYSLGVLLCLLLASPVVHPWYVTWIVPFLCIVQLWAGVVWTLLVPLTYFLVLIDYVNKGVWHLPLWVQVSEYTVLYLILFIELFGIWHRSQFSFLKSQRKIKPRVFKPFVSVIIPVLDEEKSIGKVLDDLPQISVTEVIVVDNGSTDETAKQARDKGVVVVFEPIKGYGRAVQAGLAHINSESNIVVIMDGDYSDYPEELPHLIQPLIEGEADMVIGNRTNHALPGSLMPQQRIGNFLTTLLIYFLYGYRFKDMGPFRAIRRDKLGSLDLKDQNYGWNVEMQVKALQKGLTINEVAVRYRPRIGQSKISGTITGSINAGRIILWSIWRYGVRTK